MRGPGRTNIDVSLFKEFGITEQVRLQFRAEFFNLPNHPQFDLPNSGSGTSVAGTISGTVGTPRDIQFGLRGRLLVGACSGGPFLNVSVRP